MESLLDRRYSLVVIGIVVLLLVLILFKLYKVLANRLAPLPGPKLSRWTNLRLKITIFTGKRVKYVHSLHEHYGPVVRISPNEVSPADISAPKTIYRVGSQYLKSGWYTNLANSHQERNIFSMVDPHVHGQHRRLLAYHFSEKWIGQMEPFIVRNVRLVVARVADDCKEKGWVDVFK